MSGTLCRVLDSPVEQQRPEQTTGRQPETHPSGGTPVRGAVSVTPRAGLGSSSPPWPSDAACSCPPWLRAGAAHLSLTPQPPWWSPLVHPPQRPEAQAGRLVQPQWQQVLGPGLRARAWRPCPLLPGPVPGGVSGGVLPGSEAFAAPRPPPRFSVGGCGGVLPLWIRALALQKGGAAGWSGGVACPHASRGPCPAARFPQRL